MDTRLATHGRKTGHSWPVGLAGKPAYSLTNNILEVFSSAHNQAMNIVLKGTLTHGCLKVHGRVPIVLCILLILYSQESIAWSLENV